MHVVLGLMLVSGVIGYRVGRWRERRAIPLDRAALIAVSRGLRGLLEGSH